VSELAESTVASFLADRTARSMMVWWCRPSVCLSVTLYTQGWKMASKKLVF